MPGRDISLTWEAPLPWEHDTWGMKINLVQDSTPDVNSRDLNQGFDGENEKKKKKTVVGKRDFRA